MIEDNETVYGFSITNIVKAIKKEILESCPDPRQFFIAYIEAVSRLIDETAKDDSWLDDDDRE